MVDNKIRTDPRFPAGFMDVVTIPKANDSFRLMYDTKGRFFLKKITADKAKWKLCKVTKTYVGAKKVPMLTTHDGRTIRYPDPIIKTNDTIKIDLETGKIIDVVKFDVGTTVMITKGRNTGRVGTLIHREKHMGSFDIVQVKDSKGHVFATRLSSVFVIGADEKPWITLPKQKGIKLSIVEERDYKQSKKKN